MEIEYQQQIEPLFKGIVNSCDPQVQMCILQFLETQIILNIALQGKKSKKQEQFYKLAMALVYFRSYLNRVDRSMYYLFYEEKEFLRLEQSFIIKIAKANHDTFSELRNSFEHLIQSFIQQSNCLQHEEQLRNTLQCIFFETDYPLPPCKRQTIGVYCQTPFQSFMSLIRFPLIQPPEQYIQPPLQEIRKYFLQQNQIKKTVEVIQQNTDNLAKINLLRYCPFELKNLQNYQQLEIQNFPLHNLIAILFKIASISSKSSYVVIKQHTDPIMRMAQFVTRASIFKNIVLAIEEKFGFLFQLYGEIYQVITKVQHSQTFPKFQFWNGAMTIWVQQFQDLQPQLFQSFNYIALKQREINTMNYLTEKSGQFPSIYNSLKLSLEEKSLFEVKKNETYQNDGVSYESFFQQNVDSYQVLGKDFLQHQVDISVKQFTVHKCGHSEHLIKRIPYFQSFIDSVNESSRTFYNHLQNLIISKHSDKKLRLSLLRDMIKFDLEYFNENLSRPVILKEILSSAQQLINNLAKKIPEFVVFTEQACEKFGIHFDFSHKDNLLDYFCAKSQTPNDCLTKLRSFYDIYKDRDLQQMLSIVALKGKEKGEHIQSQIEEEFYESSQSNNSSIISLEEE